MGVRGVCGEGCFLCEGCREWQCSCVMAQVYGGAAVRRGEGREV